MADEEQVVLSPEQKEQATKVFQQLANKMKVPPKPVLMHLTEMGADFHILTVEGVECVVIPLAEFLEKDYSRITGVNIAEMRGSNE
jgi:hypothetical protein